MTEAGPGKDSTETPTTVVTADETSLSMSDRIHSPAVMAFAFAIVVFFTVVGLILTFKPFKDSPTAGQPALDVFSAGPPETFEPGTVTYFKEEHFYLVRHVDGAFLALYDLGPLSQAQVEGDETALTCRAVVRQGDEMAAFLEGHPPIAGFSDLGFYDHCLDIAWDARGQQVWGMDSGDLDRFPVETLNKIVRVHLGNRRCMNEVSPESPCIPTQ